MVLLPVPVYKKETASTKRDASGHCIANFCQAAADSDMVTIDSL